METTSPEVETTMPEVETTSPEVVSEEGEETDLVERCKVEGERMMVERSDDEH